jgi:hypothetical protein
VRHREFCYASFVAETDPIVRHPFSRLMPADVAARFALAALLALLVLGFMPSSRPPRAELPPPGRGDTVLFEATIERLRAGDRYYDAVGSELRQRNYPTASVFNWRTPAHFLLVASLSPAIARTVLQLIAVATLALIPLALRTQSKPVIVIAVITVMGALATAVKPHAVVASEVWSGALIAASICGYYAGLWAPAAILGVAAVFLRELAAPYCLACGVLAIASRRRNETVVWIVGGLAYCVYFVLHMAQVWAHQQPGDLSHVDSWFRWNGVAFTVATVNVSGWLVDRSASVTMAYIALGLAGMASPNVPAQVRASLAAYFVVFAFAGQPFNFYWGWITAPLWAFSAAHGFEGIVELWRRARPRASRRAGMAVH